MLEWAEYMATKNTLRERLIRTTKIHFVFVAALIAQIIIYDASKLIPPETVLKRWMVSAGLLAITAIIWYFAKNKSTSVAYDKVLLSCLVLADIAAVSYIIYGSRGMASRAVALYAIPIVISAIVLKRTAVYATAILCIAAYTTTAISYFVLNFNEGYKIELYGEIGFYSIAMLILAGLINTLIPSQNK